jgi:hypothetical protein
MYCILQNYIFVEGLCLTAGLEVQKIKEFNIVGVKILSIEIKLKVNFFNFMCTT